jgi:transcriptional regulator with XRE-family HTH domain
MDEFVLWLKGERESRRISAKYLSERIGKSHSYIHALEKGLVKDIPESVKQNIILALGLKENTLNNLNNYCADDPKKRDRYIKEVNSFLKKLQTSELEGLIDIIRKRPDLLWVLCSLVADSQNTNHIYENLYSYSCYMKDLYRENEVNNIINRKV